VDVGFNYGKTDPYQWGNNISSGKVTIQLKINGMEEAEAEVNDFMLSQPPIMFTPDNIEYVRKTVTFIFQKHLSMALILMDDNGKELGGTDG
jgi:hypothetical protein